MEPRHAGSTSNAGKPPPPPPRLEPAPVPAPATPAPVRRLSAVAARPKLLWLIPPHGCHFPVSGEGAQTLFCAAPAPEGRPYCPHHHAIAHAPAKPLRVPGDPTTARAPRADTQGDLVDEMGEAA